MSLRTLINRLTIGRRTFPEPPPGTTHVLQHLPSFLLDDPGPEAADGWWELQPLAAWQAGEPLDYPPTLDGPADMDVPPHPESPLSFAERALGYLVSGDKFEVEVVHGGMSSVEPGYYIKRLDR